jgi:hypothetical protein
MCCIGTIVIKSYTLNSFSVSVGFSTQAFRMDYPYSCPGNLNYMVYVKSQVAQCCQYTGHWDSLRNVILLFPIFIEN